jgi:hypothetical protein
MRIGQEWAYIGSQNRVTITNINHIDLVEVLFDSDSTKLYTMDRFKADFEPYAAEGQVWNYLSGPVSVMKVTNERIVYSRDEDKWNTTKKDFFKTATRLL